MSIFGDLFGGNAAQDAAQRQINALQAGRTEAKGDITTGQNTVNATFGQGAAPLQQNYASTTAGADQLARLLGINNTGGDMSAVLSQIPGYQFTLDQGTQNILRQNAAQGFGTGPGGLSGNTMADLAKFTTGLANTNYQNYVGDLQPYLSGQLTTGGQIANLYQNLGGIQNQNANTLANIDYGTEAGVGNAQANARLAQGQAGANVLDAGMNAAKLVVQLFGML